ncbi:MAG TPA: SDR family oxidoreductase [Jatrophihabitantaceae bacterium]|nr:SDR family oxidoreductase [Jatrophihabitantaceae bacterium]
MTRTALITGVGRLLGIGAGIADRLAGDGWNLALSYWTPYDERTGQPMGPDDPGELATRLRSRGVEVELLPGDLADADRPTALVDEAASRFGRLDALVMSHCECEVSGFLDTTVQSFDRHYAVNVRATWLLTTAFARQLPPSGGSVVALTSDHTDGNLPYGATKGALDRIVLAAGHEFGERGLRANVINPGPIDNGWMDEPLREALLARQPLGRLGTPADVANLVRFLVSDEGQWINGQLLFSDGGFPRGRLPV